MKIKWLNFFIIFFIAIFSSCIHDVGIKRNVDFDYKKVETCNALKGFVSWDGSSANNLPVSLTYVPVKLNSVLLAKDKYDFSVLENKLNEMQNKGLQCIVRFVSEEPGYDYTPDFIYDLGVEKISYDYGGKTCFTPNYKNQIFIDILVDFIISFSTKYNGDARIACIQTGLIGHWGEWHTYYCKEAMASLEQQKQLLDAFGKYFSKSCVAIRIPTAGGAVENVSIGIYNDMFFSDDDDSYMRELFDKSNLWSRWKKGMITGEFAPGLQNDFLKNLNNTNLEKYNDRLNEFHNSSLLMSHVFDFSQEEIDSIGKLKLINISNAMGYDFFVKSAVIEMNADEYTLSVEIENRGVAPFYYDWPVYIALFDGNSIVEKIQTNWKISSIETKSVKNFSFSFVPSESNRDCSILIGVPNVMEKGVPLRFSNLTMDKDVSGYFTVM